MRPLLDPEEMAAADKAAIEAGTPVEVLMDRAGRAVARAAIDLLGGRYGKRVVVVCGKGNNAGDGYAAARVLAREGVAVGCHVLVDPSELKGAAREHYERARAIGVVVETFETARLHRADLIVDAIFGTGFRGTSEGAIARAIEAVNATGIDVVAIDIPSGVEGATGAVHGPAVEAIVTVAMGAEKIGTAVGRGAALAGAVQVADIGIPVPAETMTGVVQGSDIAGWLPDVEVDSHKRSRGAVAILTGADEMTGAAALVVRGAMRAGCGYVMLGCTQRVATIVQEACPEAIVYVVSDGDHLGPDALDAFRPALERATAVAIGPGLGRGDDQKKLVERVLTEIDMPLVLDADGLNVMSTSSEVIAQRKGRLVVTPHPAELARLVGGTTEAVGADRLASARDAASALDCEVLLKGYRSVVARPDGTISVIPTGGPQLATAGTGDVLTGVVAAFLADDNEHAPEIAAFLHGVAGDLSAVEGAVAWDVAEALPDAIDLVTS